MSRLFLEDGESIPVTAVSVCGNFVADIKTKEKNGYNAIVVSKSKNSLYGSNEDDDPYSITGFYIQGETPLSNKLSFFDCLLGLIGFVISSKDEHTPLFPFNINSYDKVVFHETRPIAFIERFCSKLNLQREEIDFIKMMSQNAELNNLVGQNTPPSIAAGCIYYFIKKFLCCFFKS